MEGLNRSALDYDSNRRHENEATEVVKKGISMKQRK
jgi:hypothetical protein